MSASVAFLADRGLLREIPIAIGNAIDDIASDAELVQMIALPAHNDLNDAMELVETDGKLNLNAPTNGWLHLVER